MTTNNICQAIFIIPLFGLVWIAFIFAIIFAITLIKDVIDEINGK